MKKLRSLIVVAILAVLIASCHNGQQTTVAAASTDTTTTASMDMHKYTPAMVDNKRDLACGMPVSAGIGDTAHYKGKVYGFCSKECKDIFLHNPDSCFDANK